MNPLGEIRGDFCITANNNHTGSYCRWQEIRTPPVNQIKDLERVPGNLVADAIIPTYFTNFAEFTLTIEDAQEYVYSISPTKRVRGWRDIEVKLYI